MSFQIKKLSIQLFTRILDNLNNIQHLKNRNMTYVEHFNHAIYLSKESLKASVYLFIHSLFPFVFENNGSKIINSIHKLV